MAEFVNSAAYPNFAKVIAKILEVWPKHERYLATNISERDADLLAYSERLATIILRLADHGHGGLESLARDYRFLAEEVTLPEEMHFRRHGRYRLTTFEEAFAQVYSKREYMTRYMNGLLVSDAVWINHCRCMRNFEQVFLPDVAEGADLLEVGPGHGLLLYLASQQKRVGSLTAWDVSLASLALADSTMKALDAPRRATLEERNIFDDAIMAPENAGRFDAVVFSEVLEHVEEPVRALKVLHHVLKPGGRLWVNVPANSPAPDHLFLVKDPKEAAAVVEEAGFRVVREDSYPMSGVTLDRAIRQKLTVSCVVTGEKPR